MTYREIIALLGYAGSNDRPVRIITTDRTEVTGVPTSLDTHVAAHEVYLRPAGMEESEVALSLGAIAEVELV